MRKTLYVLLLLAITATAQDNRNGVTSVLETLDVRTGQRTVVKEFPYLIEAPNWTRDGKWLVFNRGGHIYRMRANGKGDPEVVETGCAVQCNNDHVLSADGRSLAVSSGYPGMGGSYLFIIPLRGGQRLGLAAALRL